MTLNLSVLTPNRIIWASEVKEMILVTNSGQIGVLPNHAPIATGVDIGILKICLTDNAGWLTMSLALSFPQVSFRYFKSLLSFLWINVTSLLRIIY